MNSTIEKIIDLLFEDSEVNDETRAIREEMRANCQERFDDLKAQGATDDEAIRAVVESLRGMEETLAPFARGESAVSAETATDEPQNASRSFDPSATPIRSIELRRMGQMNVALSPSADQMVHVSCGEADCRFSAAVSDGALRIEATEPEAEAASTLQSLLGRLFRNVRSAVTDTALRVELPAGLSPQLSVHTRSGSTSVCGLALESFRGNTASGDFELIDCAIRGEASVHSASGDLEMTHCSARSLSVTTASGDVELEACRFDAAARLTTASGDIEAAADTNELEIKTASGDVDVCGAYESIRIGTASGDLTIEPQNSSLRSVAVNTVSGDVELRLPRNLSASLDVHTRTGDVRQSVPSFTDAGTSVSIQTVSGDITVE